MVCTEDESLYFNIARSLNKSSEVPTLFGPALREPRVNRIRAVKEHEEEEEECERKRLITLQKRVCSLRSNLEKRKF